METSGIKKRIIIILISIVVFGVLGYFLYYIFSPAPTCFDKKQNQAEKGVDCGGPCSPCKDIKPTEDIIIDEMAVTLGGDNTYDVVAKITDPNDTLGTSSFDYAFKLKDSEGKVIASREGNNFILPADSKYVAEFGIVTEDGAVPVSAELVIGEIKWEKLSNVGKPQIGVYNKNFGANSLGIGSEADGIIRNESGYDLNKIFIMVILRDVNGDIVGVNKTEKDTVRVREEQAFKLTWPYQLSASVQNMEVDVQSNVFDSQNFSF